MAYLANHWKRWGAKPEAVGRVSALCSFGCMVANHGKPWDAKPEAGASKGRLRKPFDVTLVRLHGKLWETAGRKTRG